LLSAIRFRSLRLF